MSKLNVLLAQTDQLNSVIKKNLTDAIGVFKKNQSHFRGEKLTYKARKEEFSDPKQNVDKPVSATVTEWLDYTMKLADTYLKAKLDQESTNCSGTAKGTLTIAGVNYGEMTTGELMALKGFFEQTSIQSMLEEMPTISLTERWTPSTNPEYKNRTILESPVQSWVDKESVTNQVVNWDPTGKQPAVTTTAKVVVEKGDVERQLFTGEISHQDRAAIIERLTAIKVGIKAALEEANYAEVVPTTAKVTELLAFLKAG